MAIIRARATRLVNKVAIVPGAGRGMGRGICVWFAREGADMAAVEINGDTLHEVTEEVHEQLAYGSTTMDCRTPPCKRRKALASTA